MSPILQIRCWKKSHMLFTRAVNKITGGKRVSWGMGNILQMTETGKHTTSVRSNLSQKLGRNSKITEQGCHFNMNHL